MGELRKDGTPRKARFNSVSAAQRQAFLEGLAATYHVGRAAMLAGRKDGGIFYVLRQRDPGFAAEWDAAIGEARARIENGLMARAMATIEEQALIGGAEGVAGPLPPLDFDKIMQLLNYYRRGPHGAALHGPKRQYATQEETDAALMAVLDGLEAKVKRRQAKERAERRAARDAAKAEAAKKGDLA